MSRLEEIKRRWSNSVFRTGRVSGKSQFVHDINYLYQQAERVRDLEDDIKTLELELDTFDVRMMRGLQEQNQLYKQALEEMLSYGRNQMNRYKDKYGFERYVEVRDFVELIEKALAGDKDD